MLRRFLSDENGTTAVEYALIAGLLSLAIIGGMRPVANSLTYLLGDSESKLNQAWK